MFRDPRYALMRHAKIDDRGELSGESTQECKKNTVLLVQKVGLSVVKILHSPAYRAERTASVVAEVLQQQGVQCNLKECFEIDCGEDPLSDDFVKKMTEDGVFALLVTHQPNIEDMTGRRVENGGIISANFTIP